MEFGDILRELLAERGITQKQLGQDLSLAPSTLGNYVNNLREPDYTTLKRIAQYFHVSTDYLLDYHASAGGQSSGGASAAAIPGHGCKNQAAIFGPGELLLRFGNK